MEEIRVHRVTDCIVCKQLEQVFNFAKDGDRLKMLNIIREHLVEEGVIPDQGAPKDTKKYAFTLTAAPADGLTPEEMINAVNKIMEQKSFPVKEYAWYLEHKGLDASGQMIHPHIHGMYETESGRRIETKYFQRYWPIWNPKLKLGQGFRGGYHRPVNFRESYANYIAKDGGIGAFKIQEKSSKDNVYNAQNEALQSSQEADASPSSAEGANGICSGVPDTTAIQ